MIEAIDEVILKEVSKIFDSVLSCETECNLEYNYVQLLSKTKDRRRVDVSCHQGLVNVGFYKRTSEQYWIWHTDRSFAVECDDPGMWGMIDDAIGWVICGE